MHLWLNKMNEEIDVVLEYIYNDCNNYWKVLNTDAPTLTNPGFCEDIYNWAILSANELLTHDRSLYDEWLIYCEELREINNSAGNIDVLELYQQQVDETSAILIQMSNFIKTVLDGKSTKTYVMTQKNPRWRFKIGDRVKYVVGKRNKMGKILRVSKKNGWGRTTYIVKLDTDDYPVQCYMKDLIKD